jgi:hypothetical protein
MNKDAFISGYIQKTARILPVDGIAVSGEGVTEELNRQIQTHRAQIQEGESETSAPQSIQGGMVAADTKATGEAAGKKMGKQYKSPAAREASDFSKTTSTPSAHLKTGVPSGFPGLKSHYNPPDKNPGSLADWLQGANRVRRGTTPRVTMNRAANPTVGNGARGGMGGNSRMITGGGRKAGLNADSVGRPWQLQTRTSYPV